jgi:hypothetical protein
LNTAIDKSSCSLGETFVCLSQQPMVSHTQQQHHPTPHPKLDH